MEKEFFIYIEKELKEIKEIEDVLEENAELKNDIASKSFLLLLYKMYQLERRLKVVEMQTKTHWAG